MRQYLKPVLGESFTVIWNQTNSEAANHLAVRHNLASLDYTLSGDKAIVRQFHNSAFL